jgi:mono/diheme cytochrome c family protein
VDGSSSSNLARAVPAGPRGTSQRAGGIEAAYGDRQESKPGDADLVSIISHGGAALNKSPLMAPYGYTLSKSEIQAVIAYIRVVSDPPYGAPGIVYAQK